MKLPLSFCFFVIHRKAYWVDGFYGSIHVVELDGRYKKKLLSGHFKNGNGTFLISKPRAIALNPKYGYINTENGMALYHV